MIMIPNHPFQYAQTTKAFCEIAWTGNKIAKNVLNLNKNRVFVAQPEQHRAILCFPQVLSIRSLFFNLSC